MSRIDLHLHTTHSDGSLPPAEVLALAQKAGVSALAITDHDIVAGIPEALETGARLGIEVIPGRLLLKPGTYRFVIWSGVGAKRSRRTARHSRKKDQALGSTNANGKKELPR